MRTTNNSLSPWGEGWGEGERSRLYSKIDRSFTGASRAPLPKGEVNPELRPEFILKQC